MYVLSLGLCQTLLGPRGPQPARLFCPWNFPGKNTVVGCIALLRGIFLTPEGLPAELAGVFLTISATWEAPVCTSLCIFSSIYSVLPLSVSVHPIGAFSLEKTGGESVPSLFQASEASLLAFLGSQTLPPCFSASRYSSILLQL